MDNHHHHCHCKWMNNAPCSELLICRMLSSTIVSLIRYLCYDCHFTIFSFLLFFLCHTLVKFARQMIRGESSYFVFFNPSIHPSIHIFRSIDIFFSRWHRRHNCVSVYRNIFSFKWKPGEKIWTKTNKWLQGWLGWTWMSALVNLPCFNQLCVTSSMLKKNV